MKQITRIITFVKALYFHIGYGLPKCTQKQIDQRYSICNECDFFDVNAQQCLQCGCNISTKKRFLNKLAWADQKCPIGKWGTENIK